MDLAAQYATGPARAHWSGRLWRSLAETVEAERDRWLLWLPVGVAGGVIGYFAAPFEPPLWIAPAGLALAAAAAVLALHRSVLVAVLALAVASASIGFGLAKLRGLAVAAPVLQSRVGPVMVSGMVVTVEPWESGARITLAKPRIANLAPERTPSRIRLRLLRNDHALSIGEWVTLRAMVMPPTQPALPGAYDFARQAYFQGIGGVGYALGRVRPMTGAVPDGGAGAGFRPWVDGLRQGMNRTVMTLLPGASGAMSAALITGDQTAIPTAVMEAMRDAGLAHLLAISGFNVALVAGVLFFGARFLLVAAGSLPVWGARNGWSLRYPVKKWAALFTMVGIFAYTLITGASVPTQRAFLMTAVVLVAVMIDRTAISMRLVMWAALVLMAVAPESVLGASFQMSFAAVIALIAAYESSRGMVRAQRAQGGWARRAMLYFAGMVLTTLVAAAATAPFAAYHFNRFALYQLIANFAAVPLTAIWIMPWATLVYFLLPFGWEHLALTPMSWGVDALIWLAQTITAWPNAVMALPSIPSASLVLIALGGLWLCLWRRRWRFAGLLPIVVGGIMVLAIRPPDVLIAAEGGLFAVRGEDGELVFPAGKGQGFVRDVWRRRAGFGEAAPMSLRCDRLGCFYRGHGRTVAFIRENAALTEDCAQSDVVVSWAAIRGDRCVGPELIIDRRALASHGSHALWLMPNGPIRLETIRDYRGERPWSVAR